MTANASRDLLLTVTAAIVLVRAYQLIRLDWSRPLKHGPGFFLAFEVSPGFYDGAGARWLTGFRAVLAAEIAVEWIALAALVAAGRWQWLPVWGGGSAVLYVGSLSLFGLTASRLLRREGAQPAVALSFEQRRVWDYLSPTTETLMGAMLAAAWYLLAVRGDATVRWVAPVVMTYVVVAMLAAKIVLIKAGAPLPTDRTEEHHRYLEASRRYGLNVIDAARWLFAFIVAGYALLHGQPGIGSTLWLRWALVVGASGLWLALVFAIVRGAHRLDAMGRTLRPAMNWAGPFRPSPWVARGSGVWAVSFLAGLVVLFAVFGL